MKTNGRTLAVAQPPRQQFEGYRCLKARARRASNRVVPHSFSAIMTLGRVCRIIAAQAARGPASLCRSKERTLLGSACCLHMLVSEMYCRTLFNAMLTRLSKQHPSPSLFKPKKCWLVTDSGRHSQGSRWPEYAELWLIVRLLKQKSSSLRDMCAHREGGSGNCDLVCCQAHVCTSTADVWTSFSHVASRYGMLSLHHQCTSFYTMWDRMSLHWHGNRVVWAACGWNVDRVGAVWVAC